MTPTQRSLDKLRKEGYLVAITEHWNPHAGIRQDMWGFCDLLAIRENEILAVQTTSISNMNARVEKILKHKNYLPVKKAGIRILVQCFGKKTVNKKIVWECKEKEL